MTKKSFKLNSIFFMYMLRQYSWSDNDIKIRKNRKCMLSRQIRRKQPPPKDLDKDYITNKVSSANVDEHIVSLQCIATIGDMLMNTYLWSNDDATTLLQKCSGTVLKLSASQHQLKSTFARIDRYADEVMNDLCSSYVRFQTLITNIELRKKFGSKLLTLSTFREWVLLEPTYDNDSRVQYSVIPLRKDTMARLYRMQPNTRDIDERTCLTYWISHLPDYTILLVDIFIHIMKACETSNTENLESSIQACIWEYARKQKKRWWIF